MKSIPVLAVLGVSMITCCGMSQPNSRLDKESRQLSLQVQHAESGRKIDKYYYDVGTAIDKIIFDLRELKRQGKKGLAPELAELDEIDKKLRSDWLALESTRKEIEKAIINLPPPGKNILGIQSLEETRGVFGWVGLRSAKMVFDNGRSIDFPLKSFKNGDFIGQYKFNVAPANMICVRSLYSQNNLVLAGFELPDGAIGSSKLILAGIDCDKPGTTKMRITINGNVIFSGPNPFEKFKWTTHSFPVDTNVFSTQSKNINTEACIEKKINELNKSADEFYKKATLLVLKKENETKHIRKGLVYKSKTMDNAEWMDSYIRSFDVSYFNGSKAYQDQFAYPGHYRDLDYMAKLLCDMGGIATTWQCGIQYRDKIATKLKQYNLPCFMWTDGKDFVNGDIISFYYYEHEDKAVDKLLSLNKQLFNNYNQLHGFYVDEPIIYDSYKRYGSITDKPFFREEFSNYLSQRKDYLKKHKIAIPDDIQRIVLPPKTSSPLWMEWQLFKKELAAEHFERLYDKMNDNKISLPVLLMDKKTEPQIGSWVSYGKRLPLLLTDLYGNGSVVEGFCMQLFENAVKGKALMTPGAGYSCKTPGRLKRSLSVAAAHASGVYIWTYSFFSKYRDPNYYWRWGGKKSSNNRLDNWRPEYWGITVDMLDKMKNADTYLAKGKSTAEIVCLVSEASLINATKKDKSTTAARTIASHNKALYSYLVQTGQPFDVCFIESMSKEKMNKYKLATLFTAPVMKDKEASMIREWVRQGGTLIASGKSSLYDEWGRLRNNYALSDVYGVNYKGSSRKNNTLFNAFSIPVTYHGQGEVVDIGLHDGAEILGEFNDNSPALVKHRYGKGTTFFMASMLPGWIKTHLPVKRSALWGKSCSGFDKLLFHLINKEAVLEPVVSMENHLNDDIAISIKNVGDNYIIHLIDWQDSRKVTGLKIKINLPGKWKIYYPGDHNGIAKAQLAESNTFTVRDFNIHEMICMEKKPSL